MGTVRYKSRTTPTYRCSLTALAFSSIPSTSSAKRIHIASYLVTKMAIIKHLIRFDTYVKRHPSLTAEEFHHTWTASHAQLLKNWLARHGVYR
ncbi:hypothetical protein BO83DRAFT_28297 [Aspergillus eucalypticola CBS 122712]|uniref:EthD domain-containing protein n=1 Tax=Aspergillus eucalypticola (strain CBS 122712 / IBT 29274) TaxID=1448314 RepID=A0A317VN15_ASPEC|nr:uncharacterized protein BO83DRAFT_28297 [Aspergillus eucalypticola CBS 122712]PWY74242.1 hypothetical protein BO83DRAFT_28297 [Aspergillus eucalypticola CBS 122712]